VEYHALSKGAFFTMAVDFHQALSSPVSAHFWSKSDPVSCGRGRKVSDALQFREIEAIHREVAFLIHVEGENELSSGNLSKAEAIYTKAIQHHPEDTVLLATALGKRGLSFSLRNQWDTAVKDYTEALSLAAPNPLLHSLIRYNRGVVFSMQERHTEAIGDYDRALCFDNPVIQARARYNRGWAHYALQQWEKAAADFLAAAEFYSGDRSKLEEIYSHAGLALFHLKSYPEAEKYFRLFMDLDPSPASLGNVLAARGVIYLKEGKYPEAVEAAEKAFGLLQREDIKKHLASVCYTAAICYYKSEQWDPASACFEKAYALYQGGKIKEEWANTLYFLGKKYYKSGQYPAAALAFQKVVSLEPTNQKLLSAAQFKTGLTHFKEGRFKEALSCFENAKAASPSPLIDRRMMMARAALVNPGPLSSPNATQPLTSPEETQPVGRISAAASGMGRGVKRPLESEKELMPISDATVFDIFKDD